MSMVLDTLVHELLPDVGYLSGSFVSDSGITALMAKKYGVEVESINVHREGMREKGPVKYMAYECGKKILSTALIAGALYGADSLMGIDDNILNLHHAWTYGLGTGKYLMSLAFLSARMGWEKPTKILAAPMKLLVKIIDPHNKHHVD